VAGKNLGDGAMIWSLKDLVIITFFEFHAFNLRFDIYLLLARYSVFFVKIVIRPRLVPFLHWDPSVGRMGCVLCDLSDGN
jgi:hypothetical protein